MREKNLEEFVLSLIGGELVTLVIFAATHEMYHGVEVAVWWFMVHMVATYSVWTIIDIVDGCKKGPQPVARRESLRKKIS